MVSSEWVRGIVVGLILMAAGWVLIGSDAGIELLVDIGWIFFIGGIAVTVLSGFTAVTR